MGRIVLSQNISLDGVVEDPTGEEGFKHGGWFNRMSDTDREAWAMVELAEALATEALLFGRRSYEFFATRWPSRSGEWADRLNAVSKYVVSSTLEHPGWNNTVVLNGEPATEVTKLKEALSGEIVIYASAQLAGTLIHNDLIDELRLTICPVLLGHGRRLFPAEIAVKSFRLLDTRTLGEGLAFLRYELVRLHDTR
jgi:dihydrofolate reductase